MTLLERGVARIVVAPTQQELKDDVYVRRLRLAVANLAIPSRQIPNHVAKALFRHDICIINVNGEAVELGDIDDIIGDDRNLRNVLKRLPNGDFTRGVRKISLLFALALWMKVDYPHIARHFGR